MVYQRSFYSGPIGDRCSARRDPISLSLFCNERGESLNIIYQKMQRRRVIKSLHTSFSARAAIMNVANAMEADIAQGRKYGCTRKNCRRPNVTGHRLAGLENTPPIRGLGSQWLKYPINSENRRTTYPNVEPVLHIKGSKAKTSPILESSVILG